MAARNWSYIIEYGSTLIYRYGNPNNVISPKMSLNGKLESELTFSITPDSPHYSLPVVGDMENKVVVTFQKGTSGTKYACFVGFVSSIEVDKDLVKSVKCLEVGATLGWYHTKITSANGIDVTVSELVNRVGAYYNNMSKTAYNTVTVSRTGTYGHVRSETDSTMITDAVPNQLVNVLSLIQNELLEPNGAVVTMGHTTYNSQATTLNIRMTNSISTTPAQTFTYGENVRGIKVTSAEPTVNALMAIGGKLVYPKFRNSNYKHEADIDYDSIKRYSNKVGLYALSSDPSLVLRNGDYIGIPTNDSYTSGTGFIEWHTVVTVNPITLSTSTKKTITIDRPFQGTFSAGNAIVYHREDATDSNPDYVRMEEEQVDITMDGRLVVGNASTAYGEGTVFAYVDYRSLVVGFMPDHSRYQPRHGIREEVYKNESIINPSYLRRVATRVLTDKVYEGITVDIDAVDQVFTNSSISYPLGVGDTIRVVSAPHGIDVLTMVTQLDVDIDKPENSKITIGKPISTLSGRLKQAERSITISKYS